jgi:hypothetical protein
LNRAFSKGSAAKLLRPRIPCALNSAHFMLTRLFSKGSATLRPTLYAGSQTGAFLSARQKRFKGRANILPHESSKILTLREVFVGLPSGRKTTYVCAVPAVSETRPATRSGKSRFAIWSWRRDLNPRPSDYKSDALPAELRQRETSRNRAQS